MSRKSGHHKVAWPTVISLGFTMLMSIGSLAYSAGVLSTRVEAQASQLEEIKREHKERLNDAKGEQKLLSSLQADMAASKAELSHMNRQLSDVVSELRRLSRK